MCVRFFVPAVLNVATCCQVRPLTPRILSCLLNPPRILSPFLSIPVFSINSNFDHHHRGRSNIIFLKYLALLVVGLPEVSISSLARHIHHWRRTPTKYWSIFHPQKIVSAAAAHNKNIFRRFKNEFEWIFPYFFDPVFCQGAALLLYPQHWTADPGPSLKNYHHHMLLRPS